MTTPRHFLGITLIICWALLLSARCLAAGIYSTHGGSYEAGLEHIGSIIPTSAWASLIAGLVLFFCPAKTTKNDNTK